MATLIFKSRWIVKEINMKRFLAFLLVVAMIAVTLVSCNSAKDGSDNSNSTTDSGHGTDDSNTSSDEDGSDNNTEIKNYPNDSELIGYCTQDSLYDGEFNSKVGWKAAGMGYIVKTGDGNLIAIDGGNYHDGEAFYALLDENYDKEEKLVVDYWILTHPHIDHIGAFLSIASDQSLASNIVVKNLIYYFPSGFDKVDISSHIKDVQRAASTFGAKTVIPKINKTIEIDDVSMDFLYIPADYSGLDNVNQLSLIFTVTSKKKVMITGDAFANSLIKVANQYGKELKSDIIQMPHHFLCDTGYKAFYDYVGAECMLLPTCIAGYSAMTREDSEYKNDAEFKLHKNMLKTSKSVYKSFEGNFKIKI